MAPADRVSVARASGFTLIELMVVVSLVALASAGVAVALRDSGAQQLEREALRLSSLLEAARAQSRVSGTPILWRSTAQGFEFPGAGKRRDASESLDRPREWLVPGTTARLTYPRGAATLVLGPEPVIGPQQLVLALGGRQLTLGTDGVRPFAVVDASVAP